MKKLKCIINSSPIILFLFNCITFVYIYHVLRSVTNQVAQSWLLRCQQTEESWTWFFWHPQKLRHLTTIWWPTRSLTRTKDTSKYQLKTQMPARVSRTTQKQSTISNHNSNSHNDFYGAVTMAPTLQEFTWFIRWMENSTSNADQASRLQPQIRLNMVATVLHSPSPFITTQPASWYHQFTIHEG